MKKRTTKNTTKKSAVCACKVVPAKKSTKNITCTAKITPLTTTIESEIAPEIEVKRHKDPRLPAVGTIFTKHFKGKDHEIVVTEEGLKWEGRTYKSLSGLAMAITEYPISGYVFFHKEMLQWQEQDKKTYQD